MDIGHCILGMCNNPRKNKNELKVTKLEMLQYIISTAIYCHSQIHLLIYSKYIWDIRKKSLNNPAKMFLRQNSYENLIVSRKAFNTYFH